MKLIQVFSITIGILIVFGSIHVSILPDEDTIVEQVRNHRISSTDDTVIWEVLGNPDYLDPHTNYEWFGSFVHYNVYETLFTYEWDSLSTEPTVPLLAEHLEISSDGLNYTFTLREGISFHDGTPFNASCVRYNIERVLGIFDPSGPAWMIAEPMLGGATIENAVYTGNTALHEELWNQWVVHNAAGTGAVIVLDDYTVRVRLAYAYTPFLAALTYEVGAMMSPTWVEDNGGIVAGSHNPVVDEETCGTGPYMVTEWTPDERIVLERYTNYWREDAAKVLFPFAGSLDTIIIKTNEDVNSRILNLKAGDADSVFISASHAAEVYNNITPPDFATNDGKAQSLDPSVYKVWAKYPTFTIATIHFTMSDTIDELMLGKVVKNPFRLKNIRKAFSYAFDYQTVMNQVLDGFGEQGQGPIPKGMFGHDDSAFVYPYDLDEARLFWNAAMNDDNLNEILANNSYTINLYYTSGFEAGRRAMLLFKDGLEALLDMPGTEAPSEELTINVQAVESSTYIHAMIDGKVGVWMSGWGPDYADPDDYVVPYVKSTGTYAYWGRLGDSSGWDSTTVDGLIEDAAVSQDDAERIELYEDIQAAIIEHAAYIWAWQATSIHVCSADLYNSQYVANPMHDTYFYHCWKSSHITTPTNTTNATPFPLIFSNIIIVGSVVGILVVVVLIIRNRR